MKTHRHIVLSSLLVVVGWSPSPSFAASSPPVQCRLVFPARDTKVFVPPTPVLEHVVRIGGSFGAPSRSDFMTMVMNAGKSASRIQSEWMPTALGGAIWTMPHGRNSLAEGSGYFVEFKIKPDYRFYDMQMDPKAKVWNEWLKANGRRPNRFPKEHVEMLKQDGVPFHSEFYEEQKLAGYIHRYGGFERGSKPSALKDSAFNIVNAKAIGEIRIEREFSLQDLNRELRDENSAEWVTEWPSSWKKKVIVFQPK